MYKSLKAMKSMKKVVEEDAPVMKKSMKAMRVQRSTSSRGTRAGLWPVRTDQEQSAPRACLRSQYEDAEQDQIVATMCVGAGLYLPFSCEPLTLASPCSSVSLRRFARKDDESLHSDMMVNTSLCLRRILLLRND